MRKPIKEVRAMAERAVKSVDLGTETDPNAPNVDPNVTQAGTPRKRRASGPRRPSPLYIFVKINENGKPSLAAAFRDPRKMATYFNTSKEEGSELLVITPE